MGLLIQRLVVGPFETNCYLAADECTRQAVIIDPGGGPEEIIRQVESDGLTVIGIVNTHGHADHIAANAILKTRFNCPILIHRADGPSLTDSELNFAAVLGQTEPLSPPADRLLEDGDQILVGNTVLRVIHTPGHSQGGISLFTDGILFSGDTLFAGGIGTDLYGGSYDQLMSSIRDRLLILPGETIVYPGHGPHTTIEAERRSNPWL